MSDLPTEIEKSYVRVYVILFSGPDEDRAPLFKGVTLDEKEAKKTVETGNKAISGLIPYDGKFYYLTFNKELLGETK